ncbi:family 43 glycosylhydrolase [Mangrovimonas sp. CR14]|uniref:glycoside hydrolase family 43 protein n=1 Tax=Mangrovimonas sp. CR14 TaxID=2706120 RepID=UPI00141F694D|nr:glycoside hydrolase family 43 protein [Mangrovimonas sp. CR14]NIK91452.1 family 43 glycosylhydrolase [Mangrovimonas sp. CR14]
MKNFLFVIIGLASLVSCDNQNKVNQEVATETKASETSKPLKINNPIIKDKFTADPAALVHEDTVYLYAGHDEAPNDFHFYRMNEWLVFSSTNMVDWEEHPVPLKPTDFSWAKGDAWAAQVIERNGKFYWYVTVEHDDTHPGKAIGVAVSDSPIGPFKDALGRALVTNDMTTDTDISWDDIDPTVFMDGDQAYLYWGNTKCYWAKLKDNMIEFDGDIHTVDLPHFTEAPWVHKKGDWYYLSYAYQFPEKTAYAMSKSIEGPWEYKGILNELAGNSNTNHQAILEYKGKDYFIYHTGGIQPNGGSFRRSVCIDELKYNEDGTLKRVVMTSEGIQK